MGYFWYYGTILYRPSPGWYIHWAPDGTLVTHESNGLPFDLRKRYKESDMTDIVRALDSLDNLITALLEWRAVLEDHPDVDGNEYFYEMERVIDNLVEEERALLLREYPDLIGEG